MRFAAKRRVQVSVGIWPLLLGQRFDPRRATPDNGRILTGDRPRMIGVDFARGFVSLTTDALLRLKAYVRGGNPHLIIDTSGYFAQV